jgi:hypothetical protein
LKLKFFSDECRNQRKPAIVKSLDVNMADEIKENFDFVDKIQGKKPINKSKNKVSFYEIK